jgi:hypothetical protein
MTNQKQKIGAVSRLKSGVQAIATKLHNLPVLSKDHTARSSMAIIEEHKTSLLRVLPPVPPPSPPPGALIAAENWPEPAAITRPHRPRRNTRNAPVKCAGSAGGAELACIAEDDADDIEASSSSELDTASTGMESYSTDATSRGSCFKEGDDRREGRRQTAHPG